MPRPGLYEQLLTLELEETLQKLDASLLSKLAGVHKAEVADRVAFHLSGLVTSAIQGRSDKDRVEFAAALASDIVELVADRVSRSEEMKRERLVSPAQVLAAIVTRRPDGSPDDMTPPLMPLLDTALLTNASGEPGVAQQLKSEIQSADRVDVVMAFIRLSGLRTLLEPLRRHSRAGKRLRVLTTIYTGTTEQKALEALIDLGAEVRVSYDLSGTRLHAKAWLFHRDSGFSTAFVGSSNLTHQAQVTGLEWNVRASAARNAPVVEKVTAVFETYWNSGDFEPFDSAAFEKRAVQSGQPETGLILPDFEITLQPFQDRLLELLAVSRQKGHHRNLLVAATGTGKTVMAALDYGRLKRELPRARLLFVAHRKEILQQAQATFRFALREPSFGELWVDGEKPTEFEHVFASIQSLGAKATAHLDPAHFDVVIVDEFHRAAASSYESLLSRLDPRELLGLTATPERADGLDVVELFGGRIAGELRLWDAIEQHRLVPFIYYGIHDGLDLRDIPWKRTGGYDEDALSNLLTANDAWARIVLRSLREHVDSLQESRVLGFCVNVAHARFMARTFQAAGVACVAISGETSSREREEALKQLRNRELNVIFSVDLFNEGVDLPQVDTLLMLRPTQSATLFLQQLGRGLRKSPDKTFCTVLDFVGQHRREFRFDVKLRGLLGCTRGELQEQLAAGFPYLPSGCQMSLDRKSSEIILESLRSSIPTDWNSRWQELQRLRTAGRDPALQEYLNATGLELDDVYSNHRGWSELRERAGCAVLPPGPDEISVRRAVGRLLHINDHERIEGFKHLVHADELPPLLQRGERELRLARMLIAQLLSASPGVNKETSLQKGAEHLWRHPQVLRELRELLPLLEPNVTHVQHPVEDDQVPLRIHAQYTRVEILAAFGVGDTARVGAWQTGVRWLPHQKADLLAFTLDKTGTSFSPTTRYKDYAISRELIHWESQNAAGAETRDRYQHHASRGSKVYLFARLKETERAFWFLGPAEYVSHTGERPMAVTWKLQHPLPGDLYASFAAVA